MTRWRPAFDGILRKYHAQGLAPHMITMMMLDNGFPISQSDVNAACRRLGLKPNKSTASNAREPTPPRPIDKPNPVQVAQTLLGKRLKEKDGGYWLDGRPAKLVIVMKEANRLARENFRQVCATRRPGSPEDAERFRSARDQMILAGNRLRALR